MFLLSCQKEKYQSWRPKFIILNLWTVLVILNIINGIGVSFNMKT